MIESTAKRIADAFLCLSTESGDKITNLKLQKLLYYAQAWRLALRGNALFRERIEAWVHGPVVPEIFRMYKHLKWNPIPDYGTPIDSVSVERHLCEVWKAYASLDATELERLTHAESPWISARRGIAVDEPSHNVISHESMKKYYAGLLSGRA
jgi:uncharacterized phage-associated protein